MKKRLLALMLAGAFVMQSSAALAVELDVSEDVIEDEIVLTDDLDDNSGLVPDETAPNSADTTVEDDVQSITVRDTATSGTCGTNVYWKLEDGTLTISGTGAMQDWGEVQSTPWYPLNTSITKVIVGDEVTAIGSYAFFALGDVTTVNIGKKVTRIGDRAFGDCVKLESINIPDGVTEIEGAAFWGCSNLKEVVLPESVKSIGANAFYNCKYLESINIPNGVKEIEQHTFENCKSLQELVLPESVERIVTDSFIVEDEGCSQLTLTILNPACIIKKMNDPKMDVKLICGYKDSTAQAYAKEYGIPFKAICKPETHEWNAGTVTTPATCVKNGVKTYTCTVCGDTKTEVIPATGHKWDSGTVTTPATCVKNGVKTYHCTNSGCTETKTEVIPATGHKWDSGTVTTPATCNKTGVKTYQCTNSGCTETKTEVIPATGKHTYATTITKAKPGKNGSIVKKCTVCGKIESKTAISAPKTVVLSKTAYTYSGKAKNPTITVKDAAGKTISSSNYTVSYATTRKSVGTHKVTVTFRGSKYTGTLSTKFVINPKAPSIKSASNLVKGVKVTWKPVSGITGYQIQLSTNKSFKNSKIITVSKTATSKKITGLSTGTISKKYYVRVRTYKKVSGNWYYSDWSAAKSAHAVKYSK